MTQLFKVLILVCSIDVTPPDCGPDTALDVILGPPAANEMVCERDGEAYVAGTPLVVANQTYPKILCTRSPTEDPVTIPVRASNAATNDALAAH